MCSLAVFFQGVEISGASFTFFGEAGFCSDLYCIEFLFFKVFQFFFVLWVLSDGCMISGCRLVAKVLTEYGVGRKSEKVNALGYFQRLAHDNFHETQN